MAGYINLFDPALQRPREWLSLTSLSIATAGIAALFGVLGGLARLPLATLQTEVARHETRLIALREQLRQTRQALEAAQRDEAHAQEEARLRQLIAWRSTLAAQLEADRAAAATGFAEHLRGLARQSLDGVWITGYTWDAASGSIEIRGRTLDPGLLPAYLQRLGREAVFRGQAFATMSVVAVSREPPASATAAAPVASTATTVAYHEFVLAPRQRAAPEGEDSRR